MANRAETRSVALARIVIASEHCVSAKLNDRMSDEGW